MITFKGRSAAALLAAFALACGDDPPADGCLATTDCPESQACVFLDARATSGVCVQPAVAGLGIPGTLNSTDLYIDNQLDILFVVDNSPAIAPRLPQLTGAMTAFADALLAATPALSLRVGVTTTDAGNPRCAATPERGALRLDTCRAHLDDYLDAGAACTDACSLESLALQPTPADDGDDKVRPWLEVSPWGDNLPDGVDLAEALRCAVPQGTSGCQFTSPLASFEHAVARTGDDSDPAFAFLRHDADLLVIVISAGNDCSVADGHDAIFDDNPIFWGDLQLPDLTPAICWRAGVTCDGPGPVYTDCLPTNLGDDGLPTAPDDAVLKPAQRFADLLHALQEERQIFDNRARVLVFSVAGVPPDHADGQPIVYADAEDPTFQAQHGIGPGCGDSIAAPPPIRLLTASAGFTPEDLPAASICRTDWSDSFTRLAGAAVDNLRPSCFPRCAADFDPDTPTLEPSCDFSVINVSEDWATTVPACVLEGDTWVSQGGSPRCVIIRTGGDLDPRCAEEGYNLELEVLSTEPDPPGSQYRASCLLSPNKIKDCPLL